MHLMIEAVVPRQRPVQPSLAMTSRVVQMIKALLDGWVNTTQTDRNRLPCPYHAIALLHSRLEKIDCSSVKPTGEGTCSVVNSHG